MRNSGGPLPQRLEAHEKSFKYAYKPPAHARGDLRTVLPMNDEFSTGNYMRSL